MKTTKELIIADITAKVEAKLASQKVELANLKTLENRLKDIFVYEKKLDVINPKLIELNKQKQDAVSQLKLILKNSLGTLADFEAAAKELGVSPENVFEYKALKNETAIVKEYIK
jgi:hypothetical protein